PRPRSREVRCSAGARACGPASGGQLQLQTGRLAVDPDAAAAAAPVDGEVERLPAHAHALDADPVEERRLQGVDANPPGEDIRVHPAERLQEVEERARAPGLRAAADEVLARSRVEAAVASESAVELGHPVVGEA